MVSVPTALCVIFLPIAKSCHVSGGLITLHGWSHINQKESV